MLPETRHSLIGRLKSADDLAAWERFVSTYHNTIVGYCRNHGLQEEDAYDVAQEVYIALLKAIEKWQPSQRVGSFRAWLLETARRLCLQSIRNTQKHSVMLVEPSQLHCIDQAPIGTSEWQKWALQLAFSTVRKDIQPQTWNVFYRVAIQQQSPETVAYELGISLGAVYTSKCRVLARIRDFVQTLSREYS